MKTFLFALALEFFFDCVPENTPIEQYPYAVQLQEVMKDRKLATWTKNKEDCWLFWNLGARVQEKDLEGMPPERLILFMWEPPTVQKELYDPAIQERFGKIFTWDDDLVDNRRFFKFFYPAKGEKLKELPAFEEKKFCTMIARRLTSDYPKQLYRERESMIRFFEDKPGEFDLYGTYWEKKRFKNWKGSVPDKLAVLKNYKYCICYENTRDVKGYITEKIFDCFQAGVVPVYWGASNVTEYIPADCFIDRRLFKDNEAVYQFLKKIPKEEYERYLRNAEAFLESEKAKVFTAEYFWETFKSVLD